MEAVNKNNKSIAHIQKGDVKVKTDFFTSLFSNSYEISQAEAALPRAAILLQILIFYDCGRRRQTPEAGAAQGGPFTAFFYAAACAGGTDRKS